MGNEPRAYQIKQRQTGYRTIIIGLTLLQGVGQLHDDDNNAIHGLINIFVSWSPVSFG